MTFFLFKLVGRYRRQSDFWEPAVALGSSLLAANPKPYTGIKECSLYTRVGCSVGSAGGLHPKL